MLKKLINSIARVKNPDFELDRKITAALLLTFIFDKSLSLLRGFRLLFYFRLPRFLFLGRGVRFFKDRKSVV